MHIDVECFEGGCIASVSDGSGTIYATKQHPRAGCAVREAMLFLQQSMGKPNQHVKLQILEWK